MQQQWSSRSEESRFYGKRRDIDAFSVHANVAVAHQLPRLRARCPEADAVNGVVEPPLQHAEHVLAGNALHAAGLLEQIAELVFEQLIIAARLLLFAKLQSVADNLRLAILAVLAGSEIAFFNRAFFGVAALALTGSKSIAKT